MLKKRVKKIFPSILSNQRPKKNPRQRHRQFRFYFFAGIVVLVLGLIFTSGYLLYKKAPAYLAKNKQKELPVINWQIQLIAPSTKAVSADQKEQITLLVEKNIGLGDFSDLQRVAKTIQNKFDFEKVSLLKTTSNRIVITVKPRTAYLRIEADKTRYVTEAGEIFGRVSSVQSAETATDLPLISGIFDGRTIKFVLNEDGTLQLSDSELQLVKEGIELFKILAQAKFNIDSIKYIRYRGFSTKSTDEAFEAVFGRAPFEKQLTKLVQIMDDSKKRGSQLVRIELDYKGKAFVTEKKM